MNYLISAYSINPYKGSEDAVGWNWLVQIHKHSDKYKDKIYVVTRAYNAEGTLDGIKKYNMKNVELVLVDTYKFINDFRIKYPFFHHAYYMLWQSLAYKWAKNSKIKFDVIHHVTMGDFRITGKMYKFKDAYTIFGPVGGGQVTPDSLKCYESNKSYEKFRQIINDATIYLPGYGRKIKKFNSVYTINDETAKIMEKASKRKINLLFETGILPDFKNLPKVNHAPSKATKIIFVGRLIEKKGLIFLLDIIKLIPDNLDYTLEIYGDGPLKDKISKTISNYGLNEKVFLKGSVPYEKIASVYKNADIFVLPSLRETGGNVLVEAMAYRLPICALDMSFSHQLNKNSCGLFANTNQSKEEIIKEFANNIITLINNPELRRELGENGYNYANEELTWDKKFETVYIRNKLSL